MGFEKNLGTHPLGNVYPLIIVAVTLTPSITFSKHYDVLFCTVVSTIIVHVTKCCVVVTSSCTLSLEYP